MQATPSLIPWSPVLLVALLFAGCSQSGPPRAPIRGEVTIGGQPLASGRIIFVPAAPNKGPSTSGRIVNGQYELTEQNGPVIGKNLVQIEADLDLGFAIDDEQAFALRGGKPLPPNAVPPEFNTRSTQLVDVKEGETNHYSAAIPRPRHVVSRRSS